MPETKPLRDLDGSGRRSGVSGSKPDFRSNMIVRQQGWVGTLGGEATGASCTGLAVFEAGLLRNARYGTLVRGHSGAPRRLKLYQHDECSNEQATTRYEVSECLRIILHALLATLPARLMLIFIRSRGLVFQHPTAEWPRLVHQEGGHRRAEE